MGAAQFHLIGGLWRLITHNWALASIIATVVLVIGIFALIIGKYIRIALNIMQESPLPLSMKVRDFRPLPGEDVEFWGTDGLRLRGTLCVHRDHETPARGMILFAPEFKADRESCARYCRALWDAGYDLFTFDFRNHGESAEEEGYTPRQWASDREVADMTGAMIFLERWLAAEKRPCEYGLFGISRGGCAGIVAAAHRPCVKAIVVDGAFSADRILEYYLRRYADIFATVEIVYRNHPPEFWRLLRWLLVRCCERRFGCTFPSVQRAIARMKPRPMLFIHGGRDSYIPERQSRLLYAVASQPRYLWVVPGAKHNQSVVVEAREYARRTVDFFDFYLAGAAGPDNCYSEGRLANMIAPDAPAESRTVESRSPVQIDCAPPHS